MRVRSVSPAVGAPVSLRRPRGLSSALGRGFDGAAHRGLAWTALAVLSAAGPAHAQLQALSKIGGQGSISRDQPVTFTADSVAYDRERGIVTAEGHVEAWQNDHVLRADRIIFDRNTNVAAATGNVVLLEPDGQVLFSDYAELSEGMRNGVLRGMRAILAENGKLAANGARRTEGKINELSRVVYSTCNLCKEDPSRPPLWQLRALSAVQDVEHKRIEYSDAEMEMWGVPVAYFPYFWHADPSVKRASGLLIPSIGTSSHIGQFASVPYYGVLDDQSDVTITPMLTTQAGPNLALTYRRRFNDGELSVAGSMGYLEKSLQGLVDAKGRFNYDETWRYGFDLQRASSTDYVRDFHLSSYLNGTPVLLTSQAFVEGFGQGAYARLDTKWYQGLTTSIIDARLPIVLPRFEYSYFGQIDPLGGRLSVDTQDFNVIRNQGTNTQRASLTLNWERPFTGQLGDLWQVTLHGDAAAYNATVLNGQPNFSTLDSNTTARALPQAALDFRWPFMRDSENWGTQLLEPMVQLVVAPNAGNSQIQKIPNEDSLDLEFTDANLFGFNRFPGIDRLEGGSRANVALHGAWFLNGTAFDGLIGQSYRTERNPDFLPGSGLEGHVSDIVARATLAPTDWLDLSYRTRFDKDNLKTKFADALASVGVPKLRITAGYIYSTFNPYNYYEQAPPPPVSSGFFTPRNEITLGASTTFNHYRFSAYGRRDLATNQMVGIGAEGAYEDECYIFDVKFFRRYTSVNNDSGSSTILFQLTFKTVGQFGFHAM
jgi:LPS-assembly protein